MLPRRLFQETFYVNLPTIPPFPRFSGEFFTKLNQTVFVLFFYVGFKFALYYTPTVNLYANFGTERPSLCVYVLFVSKKTNLKLSV